MFDNKTILVTGGTGSFGQIHPEAAGGPNVQSVHVFSRGELLQPQMSRDFDDGPRLRFLIGDVRDKDRLSRAMNGVDLVVHAAAMKQVPACEYNPTEAIRTNIDGVANVVDAAIDNGVPEVMALSTDKAVHPVNHYGATKPVAETLLAQGNTYAGNQETVFGVVRYGNVFGSRGSVVPLVIEQGQHSDLLELGGKCSCLAGLQHLGRDPSSSEVLA